MSSDHEPVFRPLVTSATTSQSLNVGSIMDAIRDGTYSIPEYQRDSSQWDDVKKSLFIESIINNLTIPPLIVYPEDNETGIETRYVIDGQQRLTTIREYLDGRFALCGESEVEYAENVSPIIQGKKFSDLPQKIQRQINTYTINLIVLPKNLELWLRLEVFRRINEGGVPLSAHDLRLATFGESDRVWFIRLAGIFAPEREGSERMLKAAQQKYSLSYPWSDHQAWNSWWSDSRHSIGQAPSEMFLYYIIARDMSNLQNLLASEKAQQPLGVRYDKTTASVLDLYCAQLQRESTDPRAPKLLAPLKAMQAWFHDFETWFNDIKTARMRLALNSSRKVAFFIAAATQVWGTPDKVSEPQWELIQIFLTEGPGKIKSTLNIDYPIVKGKWPSQQEQIERTYEICREIAKK